MKRSVLLYYVVNTIIHERIKGDCMTWNFTADRPIYLQLMEYLTLNIVSGKYSPGDKLAPVRDLALEAAVNPNTMQRALSELERDGLVRAHRTSGRFVTDDTEVIKKMKTELAKELVATFFGKMKEIGYSADETARIVAEKTKEVESKHGNS